MIGIIFAMDEELNSFLNYVELDKKNKIYDIDFYECHFNNKKMVLVLSGVGKVNAARSTQLLIDNYDIKYILNVGVAGSISQELNVLDIVVGEKLVQYDFDISAFDYEVGYVPKVGVYVNSDKKLINLIEKKDDIFFGVISSGDKFVTDKKTALELNSKYNALCVEMEGASVAQVCYLCNIPFLIIRCISDNVNGENLMTYEEFLEKGCKKVSEFIINNIISVN